MKIVVRSYKRPEMLMTHTIKELRKQVDIDVPSQVYLVLADKDEYDSYKPFFDGVQFADILYSGVGGHNAHNKAMKHFPEGERLIFMDDDLRNLRHFPDINDPKTNPELTTLGKYLNYGFDQMEKTKLGSAITFNFSSWLYQQKLPFFEFKARSLGGAWFGGFNCKEMMSSQSHDDDAMRTGRFLEKDGGVYNMNWFLCTTNIGINPGGMQESGDRGNVMKTKKDFSEEVFMEERKKYTYEQARKALELPSMKFFEDEPDYTDSMKYYRVKLRKHKLLMNMIPDYEHVKWSKAFQENPDQKEIVESLDDFFN